MRATHRAWRRAAYRTAKLLLEGQSFFANELLAHFGGDVDAQATFINECFDPIEDMGETRSELAKAIGEGMTEKEYVAQGIISRVRRRAIEPSKTAHVPIRASKSKDCDLAAENRSLASEVRELRKDNTRLAEKLDSLERQIKRVYRDVKATA